MRSNEEGETCRICFWVATKLLTAVRVFMPGVAVLLGPAHASGQHLIHVRRGQPVTPSPGLLATQWTSGYTVAALYACAAACPVAPEACMVSCRPKHINAMCHWKNETHLSWLLPPTPTGTWSNKLSASLDLRGLTSSSVRSVCTKFCYIREGVLVEPHWCSV